MCIYIYIWIGQVWCIYNICFSISIAILIIYCSLYIKPKEVNVNHYVKLSVQVFKQQFRSVFLVQRLGKKRGQPPLDPIAPQWHGNTVKNHQEIQVAKKDVLNLIYHLMQIPIGFHYTDWFIWILVSWLSIIPILLGRIIPEKKTTKTHGASTWKTPTRILSTG